MKNTIKILCIFTAVILCSTTAIKAQDTHNKRSVKKPAMVVNIVVSGLRYDYVERYGQNLSDKGFRYFLNNGMVFTESRYDFMQTNTPAGLATLTTGANPSVHGVVGEYWYDYTSGRQVSLIEDNTAQGLDCDMGICCYSGVNLTVPALGDVLKEYNQKSKVITIAADPFSAISMGGMKGSVYWFDTSSCYWTSSSKYMTHLPEWVNRYNKGNSKSRNDLLPYIWTPSVDISKYINSRFCDVKLPKSNKFKSISKPNGETGRKKRYGEVVNTPLANELTAEFVKQAFIYEDLGKDDNTDVLNICFDAMRNISRIYGHESVEAEDSFYRIDKTIGYLIEFIKAQFNDDRVLFILTSDHGISDSYDISTIPKERFNSLLFRTIINSYLGAQFGSDVNWVADAYDNRLYLNRSNIYNAGLSLSEVQRRAADYALQFRGVANVVTSTAMQSSAYSDNLLRKIQNGFYPKRSGDLAVNLMVGYIDEYRYGRADSGTLYDYDTHVPLMFAGCGIPSAMVDTEVDMCSVAVTLSRILKINRPAASTAKPIGELLDVFR